MGKPINPKSKGYGNLGRGSPKDLEKPMEIKNWNRPRMPKERKWAKDAQKDEMGQGSLEAMEWAKEAQDSMNTSPMIKLGHWN